MGQHFWYYCFVLSKITLSRVHCKNPFPLKLGLGMCSHGQVHRAWISDLQDQRHSWLRKLEKQSSKVQTSYTSNFPPGQPGGDSLLAPSLLRALNRRRDPGPGSSATPAALLLLPALLPLPRSAPGVNPLLCLPRSLLLPAWRGLPRPTGSG